MYCLIVLIVMYKWLRKKICSTKLRHHSCQPRHIPLTGWIQIYFFYYFLTNFNHQWFETNIYNLFSYVSLHYHCHESTWGEDTHTQILMWLTGSIKIAKLRRKATRKNTSIILTVAQGEILRHGVHDMQWSNASKY